jgi:hypothetical protein
VRSTARYATALVTMLLLACGGLAAAGAAGAGPAPQLWPKDPAHNINPKPDVTSFTSVCSQAGNSKKCGAQIVRALNHARTKLGKPVYALPPRFLSLSRRDQLLVLSNDDRRVYNETLIRGRNAALDHNADHWAAQTQDPHGVPTIHRHPARTTGSTLAVGGGGPYTNPLFAYYLWMYLDGPGGPNADCPSASSPGCWGHRHVTLYRGSNGDQILMGVGTAHLNSGLVAWTELYESFAPANLNLPLVPTVTDLSRHSGGTAGGDTVVVKGYGFHHAAAVHVLGQHAHVVNQSNTRLTIRTPAHQADSGYVVVNGSGGDSAKSAAAKYRYRH